MIASPIRQPEIIHSKPWSVNKQKNLSIQTDQWQQIPKKTQELIQSYQQIKKEAAQWYTIVQTDNTKTQEWKKAYIERNTHAYEIMQGLKKETLQMAFSPQSLKILEDQAQRHAAVLVQTENTPANLEAKLQEQIQSLAYTLFPEGPNKRNSKELRFGGKGAFCLTCQGPKAGRFYDFEKQEGGGLLKLIQTKLGMEFKEAKE